MKPMPETMSIIAGIEDTAWRAGVLSDRAAIPQVQISVLFNPEASFEWYLQALIQPAMLHLLAACVGVYAMARELGLEGCLIEPMIARVRAGVAAGLDKEDIAALFKLLAD